MINKPPPFKGLNIRIPILIPMEWRGSIHQGSGLGLSFSYCYCSEDPLFNCYITVVMLLSINVDAAISAPVFFCAGTAYDMPKSQGGIRGLGGPQYRPQNTIALIIRTPKKGTPKLGKRWGRLL